ncbi:biotin/lipoyl-containing protein [Fimbriimonas ginsengisoli]|uniref:Geranyl-CoA carboxylase biotin-containing subunit n=1 Tax=Fimbriimonas ginsengisoli Gsoil 348 TaxID=661478 RepID=A0A068NRZ9_FIMGI|nr:biotin/lipoyl-containing protein [Fimbriimonas ginsengisoli]AIE86216.1 Geranyl-CoA carboxylase biotin-containing subunit [Fimbriimonas ginsengisoli Gsoil 348]
MKRFVDGDEVDLDEAGAEVVRAGDRLMVRTPEGTFSAVAVSQGDAVLVSYKGRQYRVEKKSTRPRGAAAASSGQLLAPMPGQIVDVRVAEGEEVKKGQTLLVLEAMKTQQPFNAPFDGIVKNLGVAKGDQVIDGAILAVVEPA